MSPFEGDVTVIADGSVFMPLVPGLAVRIGRTSNTSSVRSSYDSRKALTPRFRQALVAKGSNFGLVQASLNVADLKISRRQLLLEQLHGMTFISSLVQMNSELIGETPSAMPG